MRNRAAPTGHPFRKSRSPAAIQYFPPSNFIVFLTFQYIHCLERADECSETRSAEMPGGIPLNTLKRPTTKQSFTVWTCVEGSELNNVRMLAAQGGEFRKTD